MWCCRVHTDGGARTAADRMCTEAGYYDISPKAYRGHIFIGHDQKSLYRTPPMSDLCSCLVLCFAPLVPSPDQVPTSMFLFSFGPHLVPFVSAVSCNFLVKF